MFSFVKKKRFYFLFKYIPDPVLSSFYLNKGVESVLLLLTQYCYYFYTGIHTFT